MKILSPEVTRLLDKLYNLRGSDSVIFKEMESAHKKAEETKERTTAEKATLQEQIAGLEADSKNLSEQGKKLIEVLKGLGYKLTDILKVVRQVNTNLSLEDQIKEALKLFLK